MSNSTNTTPSKSLTIQENESDPLIQLWLRLRNQSVQYLSSSLVIQDKESDNNNEGDNDDNIIMIKYTRIIANLNAITKLIFGLDGKKKELVVCGIFGGGGGGVVNDINHDNGTIAEEKRGKGALELIVALYQCAIENNFDNEVTSNDIVATEQHERLIMCTLKAIKTCVIRNPSGRRMCNSTLAFDVLENIFCHYQKRIDSNGTDADVTAAIAVEEALTTLAAMCISDDLNSLLGALQFQTFVTFASVTYSNCTSMQQKVTYLNALFDAIKNEQSELLIFFEKENENVVDHNVGATTNENDDDERKPYDDNRVAAKKLSYLPLQAAKFFKGISRAENILLETTETQTMAAPLQSSLDYDKTIQRCEQTLGVINKYHECTTLLHPIELKLTQHHHTMLSNEHEKGGDGEQLES